MNGPQATRRSDLHATDDAQAQQTRQRLVEAFHAAAQEQRPAVSVTWLCERAGVARSTFYTHFATVDDLVVFTITAAFTAASDADVASRRTHAQDRRSITLEGLRRIVAAVETTREDTLYAIRIGSRAAVVERLVAEFGRLTRRTVATELPDLDESAVAVMAEFIAGGTVHVLVRWMEDGQGTPEELVEQLVGLVPAVLTR